MSSLLPKPSMIGLLPFALLVPVLLIPAVLVRAETALDCLPPEPPSPVQDAALRGEYQQEIGVPFAWDKYWQVYCLDSSPVAW